MLTTEEALRLHHDAFLFDGHNDAALRLFEGEDLSARRAGGHLDLPRMREGGFDGGVFAVWIDPQLPDPLHRSLEGVARLREFLERTPGFRPICRATDIAEAERAGEVAALIGVEGGYGIDGGPDGRAAAAHALATVDRLFEAGMRCLTLTWSEPTTWIDAAGATPVHGGLTRLGRRVLERLRHLGVAIDVSHASDAATAEVLDRAEVPVIASHSGVRAVADHPRNLPDVLLERLAAGGGVIGINFFSVLLDERFAREFVAREPMERERLEPIPLARLLDHIEHAIRVAGDAHVGLGSDFDGMAALPDGLRDARDLPRITSRLVGRGMPAETLRPLLGENFRRYFEAVLPP